MEMKKLLLETSAASLLEVGFNLKKESLQELRERQKQNRKLNNLNNKLKEIQTIAN